MSYPRKINQYDICYDQGHPITFMEYDNIINPQKRILLTSDLHTKGYEVFQLLHEQGLLKDTIVICAGDMSGDGQKGTNLDSCPLYKYILSTDISHLYFIQGNHDLYSDEQEKLMNHDGSLCCLHNKHIITPIGHIGGLNGIIGKDDKTHHKYLESNYSKMLNQLLEHKLDILVTHQPPLSYKHSAPKLHIFGHHHLKNPWYLSNEIVPHLNCNVDARIIFMENK